MLACVAVYGAMQFNEIRVRRNAGLGHEPLSLVLLRIGALGAVLAIVVYVANEDRGIPYVLLLVAGLLLFWTFVLKRTRFGRYVYRRRRQRRGGATRRHQRRPHPHLRVRDLLVHGGGRRDHPRVAPALGRHERGRRLDPPVLDRRGGHRRHVAVRRSRAHQERAARRARDRVDRQRARASSASARARSSSSPAGCCSWQSPWTRSPGAPRRSRAEHDRAHRVRHRRQPRRRCGDRPGVPRGGRAGRARLAQRRRPRPGRTRSASSATSATRRPCRPRSTRPSSASAGSTSSSPTPASGSYGDFLDAAGSPTSRR